MGINLPINNNRGASGAGSGLATFKGGDQSIELPQGSTYTLPIQVSNAIIDRALDFRVDFGIWGTTTLAREGGSGSAVIDFSVVRLDHTFVPETRTPHETALSTTLSVAASTGDSTIIVPRSSAIQENQRVVIGNDTHRVNAVADTTTRISGSDVNTSTVTLDGYHTVASSAIARDTRRIDTGQGFNIHYNFSSFRVRGDISNVLQGDRVVIHSVFVGEVTSIRRDGLEYVVTLSREVPDQSRYDFRAGQSAVFSRLGALNSDHDAGDPVAFHNPIREVVYSSQLAQDTVASDTAILTYNSSLIKIGDIIRFSPTLSMVITNIILNPNNSQQVFLSFGAAIGVVLSAGDRIDILSYAHSILISRGTLENDFVSGGAFFANLSIAKTESVLEGDVIHFPDSENDRYYIITSVNNEGVDTILTIARTSPDRLPTIGASYEIRHYAQTILHKSTISADAMAGDQSLDVPDDFADFVNIDDSVLFDGYRRKVTQKNTAVNNIVTLSISPPLVTNVSSGTNIYRVSPYGFVYDDVVESSFTDLEVHKGTITVDDNQAHLGEIGANVSNDLEGLALRLSHASSSTADAFVSGLGGVVYPDWDNVASAVTSSQAFQGVTKVNVGEGMGGGGAGAIVTVFITRPVPPDGDPGQVLTIQPDGTLGWNNVVIPNASLIPVDTTNLGGNIPRAADTVQKVIDVIDNLDISQSGGASLSEEGLSRLISGLTEESTIDGDEEVALSTSQTQLNKLTLSDLRTFIQRGTLLEAGTNLNSITASGFYYINASGSSIDNAPSGTNVGSLLVGEAGHRGDRRFQIAFTQDSSNELVVYQRSNNNNTNSWGNWSVFGGSSSVSELTAESLAALIESAGDITNIAGTEDVPLVTSPTAISKINLIDLTAFIQQGNLIDKASIDLNSFQNYGFYNIEGLRTVTNGPDGATVGSILVGEVRPSGLNVRRLYQIAFTLDSSNELILYKRAQINSTGTWGDWSLVDTASMAMTASQIVTLLETLTGDSRLAASAIRGLPSGGGSSLSGGTWASGVDYVLHQIVSIGTDVYIAVQAHNSSELNSPTSSQSLTYWRRLGSILSGVRSGSGIDVSLTLDGTRVTIAVDEAIQNRLPGTGGLTDQALVKASDDNFAYDWSYIDELIRNNTITEGMLHVQNEPTVDYYLTTNADGDLVWKEIPDAPAPTPGAQGVTTIATAGDFTFSVDSHLGHVLDVNNGQNRDINIVLPPNADLDDTDFMHVCDIFVRTGSGSVKVTASRTNQLQARNPYRTITLTDDEIWIGNSHSQAAGIYVSIYSRSGRYIVCGAVRNNDADELIPFPIGQIERAFNWVDNAGSIDKAFGFEVIGIFFKRRTNIGHPDERWVFVNFDNLFELGSAQIGLDSNADREYNYSLVLKDGVVRKNNIRQTTDLDNLIESFFIDSTQVPSAPDQLFIPRLVYSEDARNTLFPIQDGAIKFTIPRDPNDNQRDVSNLLVRAGRLGGITDDSPASAIFQGISNSAAIYHSINIPVQVPFQVTNTAIAPAPESVHYHILFDAGVHAYIRVTTEVSGDVRIQLITSTTASNLFNGDEFISFYAGRSIGG